MASTGGGERLGNAGLSTEFVGDLTGLGGVVG